ncbi:MAG: AMP-binding protein, partial [Sciscionella sp.]
MSPADCPNSAPQHTGHQHTGHQHTDDTWYTPLTPLAFLKRSAEVFGDKTAISYGDRRTSYTEFAAEVTRPANALRARGVGQGDRVAYLVPNIPEMLVAHFAVPLAGAVLVAINTRLASAEVRYICDHSGATVLVVDAGLHQTVAPVAGELTTVTEIITVTDPASGATPDPSVAGIGYDELLAAGSDEELPWTVDDERGIISINYTSGTTGQPKGVMYHHRGAYLSSLAEIVHSEHAPESRYLWTLPMFHCNGWCTTWAVTAIGGTHVCLRAVDGKEIWRLLDTEGVTHLNGAPTVLTTIASAEQAHELDRKVVITTAGAPPSPTVIGRVEALGAKLVHVYGLTETYGPYTVCEYQAGWLGLDATARGTMLARQGVGNIVSDGVRVVDEECNDVPRDGQTMGEVVMRGNNVMAGYFEDVEATAKAFRGGWFHSGDLGVWHPDGYVE